MASWFSGVVAKKFDSAMFSTGFINEIGFSEWLSKHFSLFEDKCSLLLLDGRLSHTSDRVMVAFRRKKSSPCIFLLIWLISFSLLTDLALVAQNFCLEK